LERKEIRFTLRKPPLAQASILGGVKNVYLQAGGIMFFGAVTEVVASTIQEVIFGMVLEME